MFRNEHETISKNNLLIAMNTFTVLALILFTTTFGVTTNPHDQIHTIPDADLSYDQ